MAAGIRICEECESSRHLTWVCRPQALSGVADGRIKLHEVTPIAYLSCEYCSETLEVITSDEIERRLNKLDGFTVN